MAPVVDRVRRCTSILLHFAVGRAVAPRAGHGQARVPDLQAARQIQTRRVGASCQSCQGCTGQGTGYLVSRRRRQRTTQPYQRVQELPRDSLPPGAAAQVGARTAADP